MKIWLSTKADRQLQKIPSPVYQMLISKIEALSRKPFPPASTKLVGRTGWRLRLGDYRILYTIDNKKRELTILSVAHRKDAYRF